MPRSDIDARKNRDEQLKPGSPPRPSTQPKGAEHSTRTDKTQTDPATGEPNRKPPPPAAADR